MDLLCEQKLSLDGVLEFVNRKQIQRHEFWISSAEDGLFMVWVLGFHKNQADQFGRFLQDGNRLKLKCKAGLSMTEIGKFVSYIMGHSVQKHSIHITTDPINGNVVWYWSRKSSTFL